jgi:hypothetical protein
VTATPAQPARRRWSVLLWLALYALAAGAVLGANPFAGETITPFDRLVNQRAWSFVDPDVKVRQNERSDILNSRIPQWESAKSQIREGRLPKWNDRIAGGGTFLTVNTNIFTPAFLIFAATPDPALGFHLAMLANLALAGLGMHLLLRRYVAAPAAVLGALAFEFCGFNAAWLYWPHVFTLIWAPWLFWAIHRCAARPDLRRCLPVAITTALVCLGGFPFVSLLVLEAGALLALILLAMRFREPGNWRFLTWYAAACMLGLLLAALPLAGLVLWLQQFDLGYRDGRGSYLSLHHLRQLLPPWAYEVQRVEQTMYVGLPMLILAAGAVVALGLRRMRASPLCVFGLALAVVATGLVAGLWPMWLLKWLPGMAFNSWSRAIGLLDIALIMLGSAAFDAAWSCRSQAKRYWIRATLIALALAQVVEISLFFRAYNGPVPDAYYFPKTPSIDYIRANAGPFDYVITDQSFGMSGTLGAYGLREWLAHYFRSPALQHSLHQMARKPFNSSVASPSKFEASGIKYDSPAMASYNIRYAAIDSRSSPTTESIIAASSTKSHVPLPPMPRSSYQQAFEVSRSGKSTLAAISVRLATYRQRGLPGTVVLTLTNPKGTVLRESRIDATGVEDNTFKRFAFDHPVAIQRGQHYAFVLSYEPGPGTPPRLTAWSFPTSAEDSLLTIDGTPRAGTVEYRLHFEKPEPDRRFKRVFEDLGTAVLENMDSPRGPYFLSSLTATPNASSGHRVDVTDYAPDHFVLRYSGDGNGYVVVPMNAGQDWFVAVNGMPGEFDLKDGVMPAVPVAGQATIEFSYRPRVLRYLLPWLLTTTGFLLALILLDRVMRRRSSSPARM